MFEIRISHPGLKAYRVIRGANAHDVEEKARLQVTIWDDRWNRIQEAQAKKFEKERLASKTFQQKEWALERTKEAEAEMKAVTTLLADGIEIDHVINWEGLKNREPFQVPRPQKPNPVSPPSKPQFVTVPKMPLTWWQLILPPLRAKAEEHTRRRQEEAELSHQAAVGRWQLEVSRTEAENKQLTKLYQAEIAEWEDATRKYIEQQQAQHIHVEEQRRKCLESDPIALQDYWDMVLGNSEYPNSFPKSFAFDYLPESKTLIVEYALPDISAVPAVKEVKYVATRGEFQSVPASAAWLNRTYDNVLYQIALRTLYELFQSDVTDALQSVVFNGWVNSIEKATGKEVSACVLSVQVTKAEFIEINFAQVDPKACFKKFKGISGAKLSDLSPVRPVLQLNRDDKRFVPSYEVADSLDASYNLAAMDWLDFENLIREVFEKEFSTRGGEVKITRASRDGGVDAVAFDPDPIRGGKIVIQAKRYTNTVSVSAVRDLYGTVVNEGAIKGILVTTADYGPDAYEFAKDKPLTLLSGSELLYLLGKHGHRARIDLAEARRIAAEAERATRATAD